jgi:hypothetical protein
MTGKLIDGIVSKEVHRRPDDRLALATLRGQLVFPFDWHMSLQELCIFGDRV